MADLNIEFEKLYNEGQFAVDQRVKANEYELLLPTEFESIRQYLGNDNFLSSEELTKALQDERLNRSDMEHQVNTAFPNIPEKDKEDITNYLMQLHESVKNLPFEIEHDATYRITNFQVKPQTDEDLKKVKDYESINREIERLKNESSIFNTLNLKGGFIANFINGFKDSSKMHEKLNYLESLKKEQNPMSNTKYTWEEIAPHLAKIGIDKKKMEESGFMEDLLKGRRTGKMTIEVASANGSKTKIEGSINYTDGQLYVKKANSQFIAPNTYLGYKLSDQDKIKLETEGNLGKLVQMIDLKTKQPFDGYIGVDRTTNNTIALRASNISIQPKLLGAELSPEQQEQLRQGQKVRVNGMTSKSDNQLFDGYAQINPAKRSMTFERISETKEVKIDQNDLAKQVATTNLTTQQTVEQIAKEKITSALATPKIEDKPSIDASNIQKTDLVSKVEPLASNKSNEITLDRVLELSQKNTFDDLSKIEQNIKPGDRVTFMFPSGTKSGTFDGKEIKEDGGQNWLISDYIKNTIPWVRNDSNIQKELNTNKDIPQLIEELKFKKHSDETLKEQAGSSQKTEKSVGKETISINGDIKFEANTEKLTASKSNTPATSLTKDSSKQQSKATDISTTEPKKIAKQVEKKIRPRGPKL